MLGKKQANDHDVDGANGREECPEIAPNLLREGAATSCIRSRTGEAADAVLEQTMGMNSCIGWFETKISRYHDDTCEARWRDVRREARAA